MGLGFPFVIAVLGYFLVLDTTSGSKTVSTNAEELVKLRSIII